MNEEGTHICSYHNAKYKEWALHHMHLSDQSRGLIKPYIFLGTSGEETPDSYSQTVYKPDGETD